MRALVLIHVCTTHHVQPRPLQEVEARQQQRRDRRVVGHGAHLGAFRIALSCAHVCFALRCCYVMCLTVFTWRLFGPRSVIPSRFVMHTCSAEFTEPSPTVSYARVSAKSCAHALLRSTRCCSSLSSPAAASASRRSSRLDTSERSAPPGCDCSARPSRCASSATTLQGVMTGGRRFQ